MYGNTDEQVQLKSQRACLENGDKKCNCMNCKQENATIQFETLRAMHVLLQFWQMLTENLPKYLFYMFTGWLEAKPLPNGSNGVLIILLDLFGCVLFIFAMNH